MGSTCPATALPYTSVKYSPSVFSRTPQYPRSRSATLQARGQRRHSIRLSSSSFQCLAGLLNAESSSNSLARIGGTAAQKRLDKKVRRLKRVVPRDNRYPPVSPRQVPWLKRYLSSSDSVIRSPASQDLGVAAHLRSLEMLLYPQRPDRTR